VTTQNLYTVWRNYQRRAEVLAPLLDSRVLFVPHLFQCKMFRPIDYVVKLFFSISYLLRHRPKVVFVQAPPLFVALPPIILRIPYVIDAHNAIFQSLWGRLPLSQYFVKKSRGMIVHNEEIERHAREKFPGIPLFRIADPLQPISGRWVRRDPKQVLVICSFDSDEPVDVILNAAEGLPDYRFVITGNKKKLSPGQRWRIDSIPNITLPGFVPTPDYHCLLASSAVAIVLTTREATQPSGACEALSADTQLIVSRSTLTQKLFGEWAILVENSCDSVVNAVQGLKRKELDLSEYRDLWNRTVEREVLNLKKTLGCF